MPACSVPVRASHPVSRKRLTASLRTKRNPERMPACSVPVRASHPDSRRTPDGVTTNKKKSRAHARLQCARESIAPGQAGKARPNQARQYRLAYSSFIIHHSAFIIPKPHSALPRHYPACLPGRSPSGRRPDRVIQNKNDTIPYPIRNKINKSLAVFGSVLRGTAGPDSDIDILVQYQTPPGLFGFLDLKEYLEAIVGRPVDLVTENALKRQLRDKIIKDAVHVT